MEGGEGLNQIFRDIYIVISDHDCVKELLDTVRVPLVDGESLRHLLVFIKQLDDRVRPTDILDGEAGIPAGSLALDKSRDLRVSPQPSSAHLEDGLLVLGVLEGGGAPVISAALDTVSRHLTQVKLPQVIT